LTSIFWKSPNSRKKWEISKKRGVLYDPDVVDVYVKLFKEKGFKFDKK